MAHDSSTSDACPRCQSWTGLELAETRHGLITGIVANVGSGEFDLHSDAYAVFGTRLSDSIYLTFQTPCDTASRSLRQAFRGRVSLRADSLRGEFRGVVTYRSSTDSFHLPATFVRGELDSIMVEAVKWLAKSCRAAA